MNRLAQSAARSVVMVGPYERHELKKLISYADWVVVPSRIWWENSPLVIQEAFLYGRPVICSGLGAMVEKVRHGVDGLHFLPGDPTSLAEVMSTAASTPGLWEKLRNGATQVRSMDDHVALLKELYTSSERSESRALEALSS